MLIDETFFRGELHIEGVVETSGVPALTQEAAKKDLYQMIGIREREYYNLTIGRENAKKFMAYLDKEDKSDESDKKWSELERMLVYEIDGYKYSPIAYYVYFFYLRKNQTQSTPLGTTKSNTANVVVSAINKEVETWNSMVHIHKYLSEWLFQRRAEYSGYFFSDDLLETINTLNV